MPGRESGPCKRAAGRGPPETSSMARTENEACAVAEDGDKGTAPPDVKIRTCDLGFISRQ